MRPRRSLRNGCAGNAARAVGSGTHKLRVAGHQLSWRTTAVCVMTRAVGSRNRPQHTIPALSTHWHKH